MPSRRIASSANLSPLQDRALNPFASFDSNNINKLTRIVSNGKDGVVEGLEVKSSTNKAQSIKNISLLQSGWVYDDFLRNRFIISDEDRNAGKIVVISTVPSNAFKGFKFKNLTDIEARTFTYKINPTFFGFNEYVHTDTTAVFTFEFDLESGSPREIIASVENSSSSVIYPRNHLTNHVKIQVVHNFIDDVLNTDLNLNLTVVVDPFDTYNEYANCDKDSQPEVNNGQSEIKISNMHYQLDILSFEVKQEFERYTDGHIFYKYSTTRVHPSKTLYVTPGVAIKDDVMLDEVGVDKKNNVPVVELNVSDPNSWIKGVPFHYSDFKYDGEYQNGYVYNKYDEHNQLNGTISTPKNDLVFSYNNINDIPLIDDLTTSKYDIPLNWDVVESASGSNDIVIQFNGMNTEGCGFYNDLKDLYGNIIYCVSKQTGEVIYKFELANYNSRSIFTKENIKVFNIANIKQKIDFVVSLGPIKVSGDYNRINPSMIKWANVVVYYSYFKHPTPNTSYIGLIRDEDLDDPRFREDYLVLGKVRFISPTQIDIISYENRQSFYRRENQARNIDYGNGISHDERLEWVDVDGHLQNPTTVSHSITLLLSLLKNYYNRALELQKKFAIIENKNIDSNEYDRTVSDNEEDDFDVTFIKNTNPDIDSSNNRILHKAYIDIDGERTELTLAVLKRLIKQIPGENGQVLWHLDDTYAEIVCDWLMQNGIFNSLELYGKQYNHYVVDNEDDFELCKNYITENSPENYYFKVFGHWDTKGNWPDVDRNLNHIPKQYGIDSDYPTTAVSNIISINDNTLCLSLADHVDNVGAVTRTTYDNYDIIVRFFSKLTYTINGKTYTCPDPTYQNDSFGLVASFITDSNGNQHTITFTRSGGITEYVDGNYSRYWTIEVDRNALFRTVNVGEIRNTSVLLCDNSDKVTENKWNPWHRCGDGAIIHVKREGNIFTAWTSNRILNGVYNKDDPQSGTIYELEESKIVLNLNDFTVTTYTSRNHTETTTVDLHSYNERVMNVLQLFKDKPSSWGISSCGCISAGFAEIIQSPPFSYGVDLLINSNTKEVWKTDFLNQWHLMDNENYIKTIGSGKFSYNNITKKLFWNDGTNVVEIDLASHKQNRLPNGLEGEVLYKTSDQDVQFGQILYNNIALCQTTAEAQSCMQKGIDYEKIYNKWIKVGYHNNKEYGIDPDYAENADPSYIGASHWAWNKDKHAVENIVNSVDMSGFICTNPSKKIDVTVRFLSNNIDDDWNGLCLVALDENGRQHTISFLRCLQAAYSTPQNPMELYNTTDTNIYGETTRYRIIQKNKETFDSSKEYWKVDTTNGGFIQDTSLTSWPSYDVYEEVTCRSYKQLKGIVQFPVILDVHLDTEKYLTCSDSALSSRKIDDETAMPPDRKIIITPADGNIIKEYYNGKLIHADGTGNQLSKEEYMDYFYSVPVLNTADGYSWKTCPIFESSILENRRLCVPFGTANYLVKKSNGNYELNSLYNNTNYATDLTINKDTPANELDRSQFTTRRGWAGFSGGVILHMTYNQVLDASGNVDNVIIECESTPFMTEKTSSYQFSNYKIRLDLKEILTNGKIVTDDKNILQKNDWENNQLEILQLFMNPKGVRWGYLNASQAESTFENVRIITDDNQFVVDREANKTYMFDGTSWVRTGDSYTQILPGRQYYNAILNKLYWCDLNKDITEIGMSNSGVLESVYPVGSIYIGVQESCPFTFGVWEKVSQGKCLWGAEDDNIGLGNDISAGLPAFTGKAKLPGAAAGGSTSSYSNKFIHYSAANATQAADIEANIQITQDNIYGKSTTVQPPAFTVNIWKRIA